eukprot:jgi/Phyca11/506537/fgenesh2_kg.PHYCAscaffold_20_\
MLKLVLQSAKTTNVLLFTLDSPQIAESLGDLAKLTHVDYSADAANFQSSTVKSQLLAKMVHAIETVEVKLKGATSARPVVVMIDSLNVLLQQTSLQQVLLFLRQLRGRALIGSVIARLNAGAETSEASQALAAQATAVVLVETRSSLRCYPVLSKERRREIPKEMHGLVLLVRLKKNGRSSESVEYFKAQSGNVQFIAATDVDKHTLAVKAATTTTNVSTTADTKKSEFKRNTGQAPLPVRQEEVSFNLSISAAEQRAKNQVQLPYMHQGGGGAGSEPSSSDVGTAGGGNNTLFFIDEDDPDWDDDDLDDDLDI